MPTELPPSRDETLRVADTLQAQILEVLGRALCIRAVDADSCNGCELEIHALGNPIYNLEGLDIRFVASPRHADLLLGPVSRNMEVALRRTYEATPDPKLVVAIGDCGCTGGIFGESYATCGRVSNVIPIDVAVPGRPPSPRQILAGILQGDAHGYRVAPDLSRYRLTVGFGHSLKVTAMRIPHTNLFPVLLLEPIPENAARIAARLEAAGFSTRIGGNALPLQALRKSFFFALIVVADLTRKESLARLTLRRIAHRSWMIVGAPQCDIHTCDLIHRHGGDACVSLPISADDLIDRLDAFQLRKRPLL